MRTIISTYSGKVFVLKNLCVALGILAYAELAAMYYVLCCNVTVWAFG
jgi:hypothetical protein